MKKGRSAKPRMVKRIVVYDHGDLGWGISAKIGEDDEKQSTPQAKYKCPDKLNEYLEADRLVPATAVMREPEIPEGRDQEKLRREYEDIFSTLPEAFRKHIDGIAARKVRSYLGGDDYEKMFFLAALMEYHQFLMNRQHLREFVDFWTRFRRDAVKAVVPRSIWNEDGMRFPKPLMGYQIDVSPDGYCGNWVPVGISALLTGFAADRLRSCEVCHSIFWAQRKETRACSPECQNILRVRHWRSLSSEEKKERAEQRKSNRMTQRLLRNGSKR